MSEQRGGSGGGFDFLDRSRTERRRRGRAGRDRTETADAQPERQPERQPQRQPEQESDREHGVDTSGRTTEEAAVNPQEGVGELEGDEMGTPSEKPWQQESSAAQVNAQTDAGELGGGRGPQAWVAKVGTEAGPYEGGGAGSNAEPSKLDIDAVPQEDPQAVNLSMRKDPSKQQISAYVDRKIKVRFDMRRMQDALDNGVRQSEQAEIIEMLMDFYATHGDPNVVARTK